MTKLIAKHYNLFYVDTGKIYRYIGFLRLKSKKKFSLKFIKKKIKTLILKSLSNKNLLSEDVAISASIIAKNKRIRDIVHVFQQKCAYEPPKRYSGSILDGRDITSVQLKDAMFKFFITASLKVRAKRRFEYKNLKNKYLNEVIKALKNVTY